MKLDTQTGKVEGQAPPTPEPQVGASDEGQVPTSAEELVKLVADLRKENAKHRKSARDAETRSAELEKAKQLESEAEAAKRGEFETLFKTERQKREELEAESERMRLDIQIERAALKLKPRDGALEDILKLIPRDSLKLKDGKVESLDERLAEFKKAKPYLFDDGGTGAPSGLKGYGPPAPGATAGATEADRLEAERRGVSLEFWLGSMKPLAAQAKK